MAQQEEAGALKLWAPVAGLTLSAFIFNTSEFIPIGLLSDIARDFQITESQAGMIITVYAWIVTVLSLPLMLLASKVEFKKLLLGILSLFVLSHFLSAVAPSYLTLMLSRAGVAFSHSIFWSIASPLAVKIAPQGKRAAALGMVITGTSVAMIAGLPLGRMIGLYMGWRATFLCIGIVALAVALFLLFVFPRVPAGSQGSSVSKLPGIVKNPALIGVYALTALIFTANFTAYSYIEPFMAQIAHMPESEITFSLTMFGIAGIVASIFFSHFYERHPVFFFATGTFGLSLFLLLLKFSAVHIWSAMVLCVFWGVTFTIFGLVFQSVVIRLEPQATPIAMSIYSGIANVGIGGGALVGGWVCALPAIEWIGYAGAAFAFVAGLICFAMIKRFISRQDIEPQLP